MRFYHKVLLICLLAFPLISLFSQSDPVFASAEEDEAIGDEEMEADVETETGTEEEDIDPDEPSDRRTDDDEDEDAPLKASPDMDTHMLFIKPAGTSGTNMELPAGKLVEFLIGVTNKGEKEYMVHSLGASFRYPQDYSFVIQNFSSIAFSRVLKPKQQASFMYSFLPSESFGGRPFGLAIDLVYSDVNGRPFMDAVFNETVQMVEVDEGLDGETFFLYVFLAALVILLLVVGQQFLSGFGKKKGSRKPTVERGTADSADVDFEWLPKSVLNEHNKSPKGSPKQSPRQRKTKRTTGSDE